VSIAKIGPRGGADSAVDPARAGGPFASKTKGPPGPESYLCSQEPISRL
jgi:hypothetical protein